MRYIYRTHGSPARRFRTIRRAHSGARLMRGPVAAYGSVVEDGPMDMDEAFGKAKTREALMASVEST